MTEITFEKWKIRGKTFIKLPNTIEEEKYQIAEEKIETRYKNNKAIFLMPVRLIENIKGIMNFFTSIGDENVRRGLFLIAGDGPDKKSIQSFVYSHGFEDNIKLLGFCATEEMVSLYERANVLVLPSFSDPSPLTLVEALSMKLPLLVSERCGNHFEAVVNTKNGYLFNPSDPDNVKLAFEYLMLRASEWRNMGEISGNIYYKIFNRQLVIENFIRKLTAFSSS
jgi:glycosyltransferase involved in cell wall biosynthesis